MGLQGLSCSLRSISATYVHPASTGSYGIVRGKIHPHMLLEGRLVDPRGCILVLLLSPRPDIILHHARVACSSCQQPSRSTAPSAAHRPLQALYRAAMRSLLTAPMEEHCRRLCQVPHARKFRFGCTHDVVNLNRLVATKSQGLDCGTESTITLRVNVSPDSLFIVIAHADPTYLFVPMCRYSDGNLH
jgi:hypothetical protein